MTRITPVSDQRAGWFARLVFFVVRRAMRAMPGSVQIPTPVRVYAHHPRVLFFYGNAEQTLKGADLVPARLKTLAQIRVATLVGCPF